MSLNDQALHQKAAVGVQRAIIAYCGDHLFVHCRENDRTRWLARVQDSGSEKRDELLCLSQLLLREQPDLPQLRVFTDERSLSLPNECATVIKEILDHQWRRTLVDFKNLMTSVVHSIRLWREAEDDEGGYSYIESKLVSIT